jgi:hypothetical protein
MAPAGTSEMSVAVYQTTRRHILENGNVLSPAFRTSNIAKGIICVGFEGIEGLGKTTIIC